MSVLLATLCLNEMEWLPSLYAQHKNWPDLASWVFVEAADKVYANCNPDMVSKNGLSVDGTSSFLRGLSGADRRITYVPHGLSGGDDPAACKRAARQRYLEVANQVEPDFVIVLDADEFYTHVSQKLITDIMYRNRDRFDSFVFNKREIWRPPALQVPEFPLLGLEVVGGFWGIPCCHWWVWQSGMNYNDCHVTPSNQFGKPLNDRLLFVADERDHPEVIHMGYASSFKSRFAKRLYYEKRGEAVDPQRRWYTESRAAWDNWKPGDRLPRDAKVVPYAGPIPECFHV